MIKNINNKIYIIEEYISKSTSDFLTETFNSTTLDAPDYQIKGGPSLSQKMDILLNVVILLKATKMIIITILE